MKNTPPYYIAIFPRVVKNPLPFQYPVEYVATNHKSRRTALAAASRGLNGTKGRAFALDSFSSINDLPDAARTLVSGNYREIFSGNSREI